MMTRFHTLSVRLLALVLFCTSGLVAQEIDPEVVKDPLAACHALPAAEQPAEGILLSVLDADGKPVAGASVLVPDEGASSRRAMKAIQEKAVAAGLTQFEMMMVYLHIASMRYVTNAAGQVTIPRPLGRRRRTTAILHDRSFMIAGIPAGQKAAQARFHVTTPLFVRVLDEEGRPVQGVPVRLVNDRFPVGPMATELVSDVDGRVSIDRRILQVRRSKEEKAAKVMAGILAREPVEYAYDPWSFRSAQAKPVELTIPACGKVEVAVLDTTGAPHAHIEHVYLAQFDEDAGFDPFAVRHTAKVEAGCASFPFVETDLKLIATTFHPEMPERKSEPFAGPSEMGQTIQAQITDIPVPELLEFRLLGVDGEPVCNESIGALFLAGRRYSRDEWRTDSKGMFSIKVPRSMAIKSSVELRLQRIVSAPEPNDGQHHNESAQEYRGALRTDLEALRARPFRSDLHLEPPALILGGRVVDTEGHPLARVELLIPRSYERGSGGGSGSAVYFEPRIRTGEDGTFAFRELAEPRQRVLVTVQSEDYVAVALPTFAAGSQDVAIELQRTYKIHGKILGVADHKYAQVNIQAVPVSEIAGKGQPLRSRPQPGGEFWIPHCLPGRYTVNVMHPQTERILHRFESLEVKDRDVRDHRLMAHDPSEYLRQIHIEVVDGAGKPVPNCRLSIELRSQSGSSSSSRQADENGRAELLLVDGSVVVVSRKGYRSQRFEEVPKDLRVTLLKSVLTNATVPGLPKLKVARLEVKLSGGKSVSLKGPRSIAEFELLEEGEHTFEFIAVARNAVTSQYSRLFHHDGSRGEHIELGTVKVQVRRTVDGKPTPVKLELSKAQIAFLKRWDALLLERSTAK